SHEGKLTTTHKAIVRAKGQRLVIELKRDELPSLRPGDGYGAHSHGEHGLSLLPEGSTGFFCGSLRTLALADVFGHLLAGIRTGTLVGSNGALRKSISMRDGQIVFATSTERHERLGNALVRLGLVAREELDQALLQVGPRARLGQVLTRLGL